MDETKKLDQVPPPYPQQSFLQTDFAQPGFTSGHPQQSDFASMYGDGVPPADQHVPNSDQEPMVKGFDFSDVSIRRGFIRKVYSILSLQLLFTLAFVFLCTYHHPTGLYVKNTIGLAIAACIVSISTIITLCCCEGVRRSSPTNLIVLSLFTLAETYSVGFLSIQHEKKVVEMAVLFTTVVVVALTVFAMQTKWDFTTCGGTLFVILWIFILIGFIMAFMPQSDISIIGFASIGAILFSIYLIHDTQLIMGGDHKYSISPEEYILGAITLYLDILNILLYMLRILGAAAKH